MKIKAGVKLMGLNSVMILCCVIVDNIYKNHGSELTITSAMDGNHGRASLHFVGLAIDARIWGFKGSKLRKLAEEIRTALGDEFDVVIEGDHLHIEFQPKEQ